MSDERTCIQTKLKFAVGEVSCQFSKKAVKHIHSIQLPHTPHLQNCYFLQCGMPQPATSHVIIAYTIEIAEYKECD